MWGIFGGVLLADRALRIVLPFKGGLTDISGSVERWMKRAVSSSMPVIRRRVREAMFGVVPEDTGALRESMNVRVDLFSGMVELEWTVPYAGVVERGARPHLIKPHGEALKFASPGKKSGFVFVRGAVKHPGFRGRRFRAQAIMITRDIVLEELHRALEAHKMMVEAS